MSLDWIDNELAELDTRDLRRARLERRARERSGRIEIESQQLVNFGSNDYLCLGSDPRVLAAIRDALEDQGWGAGASPLVTGFTSLHAALERELAKFENTEAAILFPAGYAANVGTITSLVDKDDAIYSDELNHASIIDGCRLSGGAIYVYRHGDMSHLRELLHSGSSVRRRLIVTESLFSMGGDFAPLKDLVSLADKYEAILMVDEAHATGVWGANGQGVAELQGVAHLIPIRVGTLSKALGSVGGFVAGSQRLIEWLANRARPYIFSTAMPAAAAAASLAALNIVCSEPERREQLQKAAANLRHCLSDARLPCPTSRSQIVSIVLGDAGRAVRVAAELRCRGFFVPAIRPPSVPEGQSLLRISVTSQHTEQQMRALVASLVEVAR